MTIFRKFIFIFLLSTFGIFSSAAAQSGRESSDKKTTFQVSFVPGISTSDSYSSSRFSFNIIGGYNGAFHGLELGSVFNGNRYNINGLQMAGIANVNQQQARGLLLAGVLNMSKTFSGTALSGAVNITKDHTGGVMIAGGMNVIQKTRGVSIAPLNITQSQKGFQLGVVNISGKQEGTQLGIINIVSENNRGNPIGLLSFVKNGRANVDVWGTETGFFNGGMRFGTN
ncbi:MAG TPA: hypothetical protein VK106_05835, partial [Balneolaceae bacterium]|nr:hypothetical protein [Balneolaceae bacterium]